jgi:ferredoxin
VKRFLGILAIAAAGALAAQDAEALERFPPPDLGPEYEEPVTEHQMPSHVLGEYADVAVLAAALGAAAWLALKRRSRRMIFALVLFSLVYFGFVRQGCVCPIGATQNVTLALAGGGYAMPLSVLVFFALPLVFALVLGRVFCGSVCPLGAIQDVFVLKPVRVPDWLEHALGLFAYVYLGAAVLFAATGSAFLVCQYDPFVSFFRLSGGFGMLALGVCFLIMGILVGRPYCRFVCPYGALLGLCSKVSKWHLTITPDECIECRLCEDSCPFGAIRKPNVSGTGVPRSEGLRRLGLLVIAFPFLVGGLAWLGGSLAGPFSRMHYTVRLADRLRAEEQGLVEGTSDESDAFRGTGRTTDDLYAEEAGVHGRFRLGGWLFGGWVGLVVGLKLISLSVRRTRTGYEPDRARCVSCGRCYQSCPREHTRVRSRGGALPEGIGAAAGGGGRESNV